MTAPNTTETPNFDGMENALEATVQRTLHESKSIIADDQPITDRPRDDQGRFVSQAEGTKPAGEWNVLDDATPVVEGAAPVTAEPTTPTLPEGYVAANALPAEKVQGFKMFDAEGEVVPPDLKFEINFRNKDGSSNPRTLQLDQVVNFARMGVYNHEREQQWTQGQQQNLSLQQRVAEVEGMARQLQADRERLLSDPDFLMQQLARHEHENTPEARLQRATEQAQIAEQRAEFVQVAQMGLQFVDGDIDRALDTITKALPTVTPDEITSRIALLLEPHKIRTRFGVTIHPRSYGAIRRGIVEEVVPWAQQVHMDRDSRRAPAPAPAPEKKPVVDLQARAQKARNLAVAALKPAGGNGQPQAPASPPKPIRSNRDMEELVVGRSIAGLTG